MRDPRFDKLVVFVNGAVPLGMLLWDARTNQLGPDPINSAIHVTGMMALIFIVLTLTITPVRKLSGWNYLSNFRRMLGLFAFFYACVHFSTYFAMEKSFRISGLVDDVVLGRTFIIYGLGALILMIPLAITSTNGMIKRMGARNWKALHGLIYPTAILAVIHFWNSGKVASETAKAFVGVVTVLLLYRVLAPWIPVKQRKLVVRTASQN